MPLLRLVVVVLEILLGAWLPPIRFLGFHLSDLRLGRVVSDGGLIIVLGDLEALVLRLLFFLLIRLFLNSNTREFVLDLSRCLLGLLCWLLSTKFVIKLLSSGLQLLHGLLIVGFLL